MSEKTYEAKEILSKLAGAIKERIEKYEKELKDLQKAEQLNKDMFTGSGERSPIAHGTLSNDTGATTNLSVSESCKGCGSKFGNKIDATLAKSHNGQCIKCISMETGMGKSENDLAKKSPPGMKEVPEALKEKGVKPESAFKIAWSMYDKKEDKKSTKEEASEHIKKIGKKKIKKSENYIDTKHENEQGKRLVNVGGAGKTPTEEPPKELNKNTLMDHCAHCGGSFEDKKAVREVKGKGKHIDSYKNFCSEECKAQHSKLNKDEGNLNKSDCLGKIKELAKAFGAPATPKGIDPAGPLNPGPQSKSGMASPKLPKLPGQMASVPKPPVAPKAPGMNNKKV